MKPVVNEGLCIGDGVCEDLCPEVFQVGEDGLSHVIDENPPAENYGCVRDAETACPTSAISIEE